MLGMLVAVMCLRGEDAVSPEPAWPVHKVAPDAVWPLDLPDLEPFEASGLLAWPDGSLLTVNDRGPELFRVKLPLGEGAAKLVMDLRAFPAQQLRRAAPNANHRYDCEGLARDDRGRLYLCEESQRWILRWDPNRDLVERLDIDWGPVRQFFSEERNASFEGVAVGGGRLFVANERQTGRVIEVDLESLEVRGSFSVYTRRHRPWDTHYSDLSWYDGRLYVLCRESRTVLCVDPASRQVEAEYDVSATELKPEWRFQTRVPLVGVLEGLAVDRTHLWLVTDNNNLPRQQFPNDRRPLLFRCPRLPMAGP